MKVPACVCWVYISHNGTYSLERGGCEIGSPRHEASLIEAIIRVVPPGAVATSPLVNDDGYNVRPLIIIVYCSTAVLLGGEPISPENAPPRFL